MISPTVLQLQELVQKAIGTFKLMGAVTLLGVLAPPIWAIIVRDLVLLICFTT